ncbi:MAG: DctP family TRAP transporter solute-binding subunit [Peptococcaceae bacterium]
MKKARKLVAALTVCAMAFTLTACGGGNANKETNADASAEPVVLKLATTVNEQDSFQIAAEKFAELVAERTDGAYTIEIHPNGELGDESDMLSSMAAGELDMGIVTSGPFVNYAPEMGVLDMPFLFGSNEEAYAVLDGEVGQELLGTLENANLKGLAYAERGFRNLTNSVRPVTNVADMQGLKLRVMENEVYAKTFAALGANATPMAWQETLTALQNGTIEGQENPVNVICSYTLWESNQKYATLTRHSYSTAIITMSLDKFNALPEDVQTIFKESAQEAAEFERAWVGENEATQLQQMKDNGMEVVEDPDLDSFKAAVQPVYDAYPQYADYLARIQAVTDAM